MKRSWIIFFSLTIALSGCSIIPGSSDITPSEGVFIRTTEAVPPTPTATPPLLPEVEENSVTPQSAVIPTDEPVKNVSVFPDATGFAWNVVVSGLSQPVDMADARDGRLLIVEQGGLIRLFLDGTLVDDPFLDIRDRVGSSGNEQGLLGLALDPGFLQNGRFYINYTDKGGDTSISRFT